MEIKHSGYTRPVHQRPIQHWSQPSGETPDRRAINIQDKTVTLHLRCTPSAKIGNRAARLRRQAKPIQVQNLATPFRHRCRLDTTFCDHQCLHRQLPCLAVNFHVEPILE